jgi:alpha-L-fucosidase
MIRTLLTAAATAAFLTTNAAPSTPPLAPYGAVPSPRQLRWHDLELYGFLHFTINTFTDKEWGYGDEDPALFNPTAFDADQIVTALKAGGLRGAILTCKHHDGFCLWPTKTTAHNVSRSPFRGGKGDVVREIAEASKRHGLQFGVYLSPWDRNSPLYGRPEYVRLYREQLRELLTNYGPVFEVWHDGANGGDGYYGGARERRSIDRRAYYDWPNTWSLVRDLQPGAVIFSDVGPDLRWVGNESGFADETCWATYDPAGEDGGPPAPGYTRYREAGTGHRNASHWLPAECDVSLRPGWFWHERENTRVKTPEQLFDLYCRSVGRGASFLLNVPPDRRGRLHETDVGALRRFGDLLRATFRTNLCAGARLTASNVRGRDPAYAPERLLDDRRDTCWATDDAVTTPELLIDRREASPFNLVRLREKIALGQRVETFALDAWQDAQWREIAAATSIGSCRLVRLKEPVTARRLRLRITKSAACPALAEFGLYQSPLDGHPTSRLSASSIELSAVASDQNVPFCGW